MAGVERGAAFIPFLLSGEAVAVEDPLQGGFHHPAAGVRNQQNLRCTLSAAAAARRSQNGAGADARIYRRRHRRPRPHTQACARPREARGERVGPRRPRGKLNRVTPSLASDWSKQKSRRRFRVLIGWRLENTALECLRYSTGGKTGRSGCVPPLRDADWPMCENGRTWLH